jgi:hypothetical protein
MPPGAGPNVEPGLATPAESLLVLPLFPAIPELAFLLLPRRLTSPDLEGPLSTDGVRLRMTFLHLALRLGLSSTNSTCPCPRFVREQIDYARKGCVELNSEKMGNSSYKLDRMLQVLSNSILSVIY